MVELIFEPGSPTPESTLQFAILYFNGFAGWGAAVQILALLLTSSVIWDQRLDIFESQFLN